MDSTCSVQGENGTALHEAALFGKIDVVKLLLTRGANPYALDPQNRTSLELVKQLDTQTSREISQLILGRLYHDYCGWSRTWFYVDSTARKL